MSLFISEILVVPSWLSFIASNCSNKIISVLSVVVGVDTICFEIAYHTFRV
jgi:hypothetical protein